MPHSIAIYGAGGFGRETTCLLREINEVSQTWNFVGFFDDNIPKGSTVADGKILGGIYDLNTWADPLNVVFAIASPQIVKSLYKKISNPRISFPNIISPVCRLLSPSTLKLGKGNLVNFKCELSCNVELGDFNLFNSSVTVGHDARIGNFNMFMTGTRISGEVKIGDENFFGLNSAIHQGLSIGDKTRVAGNSFVVRDTENDATYVGVPAKKLKF
ncbi:MAG: acetyltransferase [Bacteroidales bacterium]|nr:acetyltransferase [Bacteroidales bacterium]